MADDRQRGWVAEVLGVPLPGTQAGDDFARLQKCRLAWDGARKRLTDEIVQFEAAVEVALAGDPDENLYLDALEQLDDVLAALDERLVDALNAVLGKRPDDARRAELLATAGEILAEYEQFVASDELFRKLSGATPFGMTFTAAPVVTQALKGIRASLR